MIATVEIDNHHTETITVFKFSILAVNVLLAKQSSSATTT